MTLLDPDVVVRVDHTAGRPGAPPREIHGAENWARAAVAFTQATRMEFMQPAVLDGAVGLVMAQAGRLFRAMRFTIERGKIAEVDIISDQARLDKMDVKVIED